MKLKVGQLIRINYPSWPEINGQIGRIRDIHNDTFGALYIVNLFTIHNPFHKTGSFIMKKNQLFLVENGLQIMKKKIKQRYSYLAQNSENDTQETE